MTNATSLSIGIGTIVNDRFDVKQSLGRGGMGDVFLAYDRSTQQSVALKIVRAESRLPGDDEALRQELILARSVSHPNVCRVHDLAPSEWGPIMVMEYMPGQTLHSHIRKRKAQGGYAADEFRKISTEICAGLTAIHAQGLVHGDLKPGNVIISSDKAIILDFGFAQERARTYARKSNATQDGGTPNYMSPERLKGAGPSPEDDVYALSLTLWEMWTCKVPEPGDKPRNKKMKQQIMFDVPSGLSIDEIKQIFRGFNEVHSLRPQARHMRFFNPLKFTTSPIQMPRERIDPGPPLGRSQLAQFQPNSQSLLLTFASNAPQLVGTLFPLNKQSINLGRKGDQDIILSEATVSGAHALLRWQSGSWVIQDLGSTNGTYADHSYERKNNASLMHGGEVQFGESRLKLVSFANHSQHHERALEFLGKRDGLTGLLHKSIFSISLDEECRFSDWIDVQIQVAKYELRRVDPTDGEKPTILEMMVFRRVAQKIVEMTELLLLSLTPVVAGLTGNLQFAIAMVGCSVEDAKQVVEQILSQMHEILPDILEVNAKIIQATPGCTTKDILNEL